MTSQGKHYRTLILTGCYLSDERFRTDQRGYIFSAIQKLGNRGQTHENPNGKMDLVFFDPDQILADIIRAQNNDNQREEKFGSAALHKPACLQIDLLQRIIIGMLNDFFRLPVEIVAIFYQNKNADGEDYVMFSNVQDIFINVIDALGTEEEAHSAIKEGAVRDLFNFL